MVLVQIGAFEDMIRMGKTSSHTFWPVHFNTDTFSDNCMGCHQLDQLDLKPDNTIYNLDNEKTCNLHKLRNLKVVLKMTEACLEFFKALMLLNSLYFSLWYNNLFSQTDIFNQQN